MNTRRHPVPESGHNRPRQRSSGLVPGTACLAVIGVLIVGQTLTGCKTRQDRLREQARRDSLMQDSSRRPDNPYKLGQGNDQYNRERENLGNLDSLVRPAPTNPRP